MTDKKSKFKLFSVISALDNGFHECMYSSRFCCFWPRVTLTLQMFYYNFLVRPLYCSPRLHMLIIGNKVYKRFYNLSTPTPKILYCFNF